MIKRREGTNVNIGVIGTGRMGREISKCLAPHHHVTLYNRTAQRAKAVAKQLHVSYVTNVVDLKPCEVLLLCVPASELSSVAAEVTDFAKGGTIVVNTSTKAFFSNELVVNHPNINFVEAKIIGHAASMELGLPAYVIIETSELIYKKVSNLFSLIGTVEKGNSKEAPVLSSLATEAGIRAAILLENELKAYQLPKQLKKVLIESIGAGTMKAYINGDLGHFGLEIAKKIESELGDKK